MKTYEFEDGIVVTLDTQNAGPVVIIDDRAEGVCWQVTGFATEHDAEDFILTGDLSFEDNDWVCFHPAHPRLTWTAC